MAETPDAPPTSGSPGSAGSRPGSEAIELDLLLEAIHRRYGYEFRSYEGESMRRRLLLACQEANLRHLGEMQHRLLVEPQFFAWLISRLTVQTSDLFRDPAFFAAFRRAVVPLLRTYPELRFWLAGSASGEEAYSLAILLHEEGLYERSQIYVTDLDERAVQASREGIYSEERVERFESNHRIAGGSDLGRHLTRAYGKVTMREELRRGMVFFQHDLATDHALGEMHVVFCRNVLLYFSPGLKERATAMLAQGLRRGGFLCLGNSETLTEAARANFVDFDAEQRIYRMRSGA
ncbi:MAG TPA: CheR family methyltransferase [Polyangiaceae bacterium]|nr:CheR family methyltransferase [Polyangiaceae bacterium]